MELLKTTCFIPISRGSHGNLRFFRSTPSAPSQGAATSAGASDEYESAAEDLRKSG